MKNHKVKNLLIMGLSFWFLLFPAYIHFVSLDDADLLSPTQAWESPDQDGLLAGIVKKGKMLGGHFFPAALLLFGIFCEPLARLFRSNPALSQHAGVLRC